ncbi:MAG: MOSC domain-containing protein [Anaerolineales bacterium]|nr:MOSC domain-containing protein [Anaerolineales bacterium]
MKIISINLGIEKEIQMGNSVDRTGIYKLPVQNAVRVTGIGLEGDFIESKKHHGGPDQAVYIYGAADYAWWEKELGVKIHPGTFGENITISGLESGSFNIGDILTIGDVTLEVTMPRIPCWTFAARMEDPAWVKKFRQAERPGFYCRVKREGVIKAGDAVALENFQGETISIQQLYQDYYEKNKTEEMLRRHLNAPVAIRWRKRMEDELAKIAGQSA